MKYYNVNVVPVESSFFKVWSLDFKPACTETFYSTTYSGQHSRTIYRSVLSISQVQFRNILWKYDQMLSDKCADLWGLPSGIFTSLAKGAGLRPWASDLMEDGLKHQQI